MWNSKFIIENMISWNFIYICLYAWDSPTRKLILCLGAVNRIIALKISSSSEKMMKEKDER